MGIHTTQSLYWTPKTLLNQLDSNIKFKKFKLYKNKKHLSLLTSHSPPKRPPVL